MSKKILSLALAVLMLFSICAVAVSAVNGDGTEVITPVVTTDAEVGAPAGTIVTLTYAIDLPDGIDELQMCVGNVAIGWNSAAYAINSSSTSNAADARTWGDEFGQYMKSTSAVTVSSAISTNILKKANANDTAKGYNKACQVQMVYDGTNSTSSTGFPISDGQVIFNLEFVAQRTLTADDVIGVVEGALSDGSNGTFFKICYFNGTAAGTYAISQVNLAKATAAPAAPSYDVYKLSDARKHSNGDGTNTVAAFFAFDTTVINPNFNTLGTSQFVTAITATVSNGESSITPDPIKYLYKIDADTYGFRVIMQNVPDAANVTVTPVVTTDGSTYKVETVNFAVADLTNYA